MILLVEGKVFLFFFFKFYKFLYRKLYTSSFLYKFYFASAV